MEVVRRVLVNVMPSLVSGIDRVSLRWGADLGLHGGEFFLGDFGDLADTSYCRRRLSCVNGSPLQAP